MIARIDPTAIGSYGDQLQRDALEGLTADARVTVRFEEVAGTYGDGTPYTLRRPVYAVDDLSGGALPDDTVLSVRNAPPLIGLGLLEQIAPEDLLAHADPDDDNGDGVSGRAAEAHVPFRDEPVIGRFGWQASAASVEHQTALALLEDLGITTHWFPENECQQDRVACPRPDGPVAPDLPEGDIHGSDVFGAGEAQAGVEMDDRTFYELTFYTLAVAVPAVRDTGDEDVRRGAALFDEIGCTSCHAGPFTTADGEVRGLGGQVIDPGTDLLLYDLGDGLADRTLAREPVPTEWRAAPLWGLGLADTVLGSPARYLHDGRARTVAEAILWHGGEAEPARERFRELTAADREALLAYLSAR
jgi:CxxC motif-containing protein (DUF1111 family)